MNPADVLNAARLAADVLLALVPHDQAKQLIDDAAARRINAEVDLVEAIKFPNG